MFGDPAVNLLTITVTVFSIYFSTITFGGIYKNIVLNTIEYSFFLNLGILSSATLFTTLTDRDQTGVVYTSVAIAFVTFMIIILYHVLVRVKRQRFAEWAISTMKTIKATVKERITRVTRITRMTRMTRITTFDKQTSTHGLNYVSHYWRVLLDWKVIRLIVILWFDLATFA